MSFSLIPQYSFESLDLVTPEFLLKHHIKLLLLDMDNTIVPYKTEVPTAAIMKWADEIRQSGIEMFIVTNNRGTQRVEAVAKELRIGYIMKAGKPSPKGIKNALERLGQAPENTALIGDQIFTDILAANNAGLLSIIIKPIKILNPALNLRYWVEAPFRALCPNREA